jgi:hypothetical protein
MSNEAALGFFEALGTLPPPPPHTHKIDLCREPTQRPLVLIGK